MFCWKECKQNPAQTQNGLECTLKRLYSNSFFVLSGITFEWYVKERLVFVPEALGSNSNKKSNIYTRTLPELKPPGQSEREVQIHYELRRQFAQSDQLTFHVCYVIYTLREWSKQEPQVYISAEKK